MVVTALQFTRLSLTISVAYKKKQRSCFIFLSRDKMRVHIKKSMPDNSGSWGYGMRRPCRQSPLGGLSQVRPTDEEEPHEMDPKGGLQLPAPSSGN